MNQSIAVATTALAMALGATGCSDESSAGSGSLSVLLQSETTITDGLEPGDEVENIRDGWQITYDKFIVTVGEIELDLASGDHAHAHAEEVFVVDLKTVPASGLPLWEVTDLRAGRWEFNFSTPGAGHGAERHDSVSQADFEQMETSDSTYLIAGTLSKSGGVSCPPPDLAEPGEATQTGTNDAGHTCYANDSIAFDFLASAETAFGPCELDEVPGVSITGGSTQTVVATIHGDHIFFNGFPEGDEGGVRRLAQWLADSDLNLDGTVTREELEAIQPSALPELAEYQLGGSPITPLENMWDYVRAQLKTQGHINGEGECPFDGKSHEH